MLYEDIVSHNIISMIYHIIHHISLMIGTLGIIDLQNVIC